MDAVIFADRAFDLRGNVAAETAPYYNGIDTAQWTNFKYDVLNRRIERRHPDNAFVGGSYALSTVTGAFEKATVITVPTNTEAGTVTVTITGTEYGTAYGHTVVRLENHASATVVLDYSGSAVYADNTEFVVGELVEPPQRQLGEHAPLVGDLAGQHPVVRGHTVAGDHHEVARLVLVQLAHLAGVQMHQTRNLDGLGLFNESGHGSSPWFRRSAGGDLPRCPGTPTRVAAGRSPVTGRSRPPKPRLTARLPSHPIDRRER